MKNNNLTLIMLLSTLSILVIGTSMTALVYAQEENMTDLEAPKFFAIQHANSGTILEINETAYSLELNDVSDKTILFSDRPDRIVKSISTLDYIGNWSVGEGSFAVDAPNAVLVADGQEGKQDMVIIDLFNPVYDSDKKALKYIVIPDNATSIELPGEFRQSTLLIDMHFGPGPND